MQIELKIEAMMLNLNHMMQKEINLCFKTMPMATTFLHLVCKGSIMLGNNFQVIIL